MRIDKPTAEGIVIAVLVFLSLSLLVCIFWQAQVISSQQQIIHSIMR